MHEFKTCSRIWFKKIHNMKYKYVIKRPYSPNYHHIGCATAPNLFMQRKVTRCWCLRTKECSN